MHRWTKAQHLKFRATMARKHKNTTETITATPTIPVDPVDRDFVEHICNGVWDSLSLADKAKALSGLFFDPSNHGND